MINPATPDALRVIASMMRMEGCRTDATGIEALVIDTAAKDIERLREECYQARKTAQFWKDNHLAGNNEIERLRQALRYYSNMKEDDWKNGDNGVVARAALEGK